jgi:hypothetical protein
MLRIGRLAIKSEPLSPTKAGFSLPGCSVKSGGSALYPGQMATSPLNKQASTGQTATYAVASLYPTLTRPLQDIIDEISADCSGILRRQCSDNIGRSLGTGVDLPLKTKGKWWAWQGLNLRPLRCQHSALPLSYTPTLRFPNARRDGWQAALTPVVC